MDIFFLYSGAVEKQKLVYILNRDAQARLTISSPLEAHKANTLVYNMVGVDVGFENPTFACLEIDYEVTCFEMLCGLEVTNLETLPYLFGYKTEFFPSKNNPKDLDPSCKTDLDLWDSLGRGKLVLLQSFIGLI